MRKALGWLLILAGVAAVVLGAATAIVFGPDNEVVSGPHPYASKGAAVITAPGAVAYSGPTVRITVQNQRPNAPVFVGVGHDVDVRDYLDGTAYTQVDEISVPWETSTSMVKGNERPTEGPSGLDWWLVSDSGEPSAEITVRLPDDAVDIVVMDPDLAAGFRADVTVAVVQGGAFVGGIAVAVCGLGLAVSGWVLAARRRGQNLAEEGESGARMSEASAEEARSEFGEPADSEVGDGSSDATPAADAPRGGEKR